MILKIAITADVHLTNRAEHPERYNALLDILNKISNEKVKHLIIAGDLFDASYNNYSEFDKIASQFKEIMIHAIPGNHDSMIENSFFTSENVEIFSEPTLKKIDESKCEFLFLPYQKDIVMGDTIANFQDKLEPNKWVLIGHGDWERGMKISNPFEPGVYMPLSQKDINLYRPAHAFLGHIHKPHNEESMCYPGSPCGLDISETGKRRFITFDTINMELAHHDIETDAIFFDEGFLILPLKDEETYLRKQIQNRIKEWNISEADRQKIQVRAKIRGYSTDIRKMKDIVDDELKNFKYFDDEGVDMSEVFISKNRDLEDISMKVIESIDEIDWQSGPYEPSREDIQFYALKTVYGDA